MTEMQKDSKLTAALNARRKREESKHRLEDKRKKEAEAKAAAKKATEDRKKAEKKNKEVEDEREVLMKLAGIKNESKSSRGHYSSQGFFDLLNMFDNGNEDRLFEKKYNSLKSTEKIAKAVRESVTYDKDRDMVCINGKMLREMVDSLLQEKENAITAAKELLDQEWKKLLDETTASDEIRSVNTIVDKGSLE